MSVMKRQARRCEFFELVPCGLNSTALAEELSRCQAATARVAEVERRYAPSPTAIEWLTQTQTSEVGQRRLSGAAVRSREGKKKWQRPGSLAIILLTSTAKGLVPAPEGQKGGKP